MGFDLLDFLTRMLGGLDVEAISTAATDWLREKGAQYPDLKERADALAAHLTQTLEEVAPSLDPTKLAGTIKGIAQDIVNGTAGLDNDSWMGSV
jgi:truncated hemoglobin YjbI